MTILCGCGFGMPPSFSLLASLPHFFLITNMVLIRLFVKSKLNCVIIWLSISILSYRIVYSWIVLENFKMEHVSTMCQWIYLLSVSYIWLTPTHSCCSSRQLLLIFNVFAFFLRWRISVSSLWEIHILSLRSMFIILFLNL